MTEEHASKEDFYLIETLLWRGDCDSAEFLHGFWLLHGHLSRLERSARFFGFPFAAADALKKLRTLSGSLMSGYGHPKKSAAKVRCILKRSGDFEIDQVQPFSEPSALITVDISKKRVDPEDIFLYHKTSKRGLFDQERRRLDSEGIFETL
ncbi:MAG: hypothetical protein DSZ23_00150, partial [Thermodesulfatator sp.]